ncbi:LysR family transcriptional regulator [Streptomyces sp. NRRL B-24085]|uniref:LysR family transcriptional regulator n=1 Tax=Streptomyces sp. NRRL B-24085 TaxID=1709476 RepID=UPI0006B311AF|nr:LysR family transcriptional regulator [Streptomyces sp. NRRL B-24085]
MDIRALRYAVTLAEELHFGRAAQRHYISPQPFGRHIQRLERELGTKLFERTSRRVTLTPEGERLIAEARALLDTVDSLTEHRRRTTDEKLLTLGVLGFGLAERWTDLTAAVHGHDPEIAFSYAELDLADQYEAIRSHRVDVGIIQYVGPVDGLVFEHAMTVPRVVVVPARSPLADADRLTEADLSDSPWLPIALAHPALEAWSGPAADGSHSHGALRHPAAIPAAVATTGHIALHAEAASRFYPHPDVRFVPLDGPPVKIAVATRATDDRYAITAVRYATRLLGRAR